MRFFFRLLVVGDGHVPDRYDLIDPLLRRPSGLRADDTNPYIFVVIVLS